MMNLKHASIGGLFLPAGLLACTEAGIETETRFEFNQLDLTATRYDGTSSVTAEPGLAVGRSWSAGDGTEFDMEAGLSRSIEIGDDSPPAGNSYASATLSRELGTFDAYVSAEAGRDSAADFSGPHDRYTEISTGLSRDFDTGEDGPALTVSADLTRTRYAGEDRQTELTLGVLSEWDLSERLTGWLEPELSLDPARPRDVYGVDLSAGFEIALDDSASLAFELGFGRSWEDGIGDDSFRLAPSAGFVIVF